MAFKSVKKGAHKWARTGASAHSAPFPLSASWNHNYWPSCLSVIMPINHHAYHSQLSSLLACCRLNLIVLGLTFFHFGFYLIFIAKKLYCKINHNEINMFSPWNKLILNDLKRQNMFSNFQYFLATFHKNCIPKILLEP